MSAAEFLSKATVTVDGAPVSNIVQITMDAGQTTIVYDVPRNGAAPARRVLTVESEAVSIG